MQQAQAVEFYDPRREPLRGELRARVKVTSRAPFQFGDVHIPVGESVFVIWKSQIDALNALVEDEPDKVALARQMFDRELAKLVIDEAPQCINMKLPAIEKLAQSDQEVAAALRKCLGTTPDSVHRQFRTLTDRDLQPLDSVKVLADDLLEPVLDQRSDQDVRLANAVAEALDKRQESRDTALAAALGKAMGDALDKRQESGTTDKKK